MRSFADNPALKRELLDALDERIEGASLELLTVGGRRFAPYDFARPDTYEVAAEVLCVPEDLLRLGGNLFQGFPEDPRATVDHLRGARDWLAAIPVGADLGGVTTEFAVWRLTDERDGVMRFARRPEVRAALDDVATALVAGDPSDRVSAHDAAEALARSIREEIPAQWKTGGRVDDTIHEHLRALEAALCAAYVGRDPRAAAALAEASVLGGGGRNVAQDWLLSDAMCRWLLARLASSDAAR